MSRYNGKQDEWISLFIAIAIVVIGLVLFGAE